jgi:hypothetical protein
MQTAFAGMASLALLMLTGCTTFVIENHDSGGSALNYTVTQDEEVIDEGQIAINKRATVTTFSDSPVTIEGEAVDDGFTGNVTLINFPPGRMVIEWIEGFVL